GLVEGVVDLGQHHPLFHHGASVDRPGLVAEIRTQHFDAAIHLGADGDHFDCFQRPCGTKGGDDRPSASDFGGVDLQLGLRYCLAAPVPTTGAAQGNYRDNHHNDNELLHLLLQVRDETKEVKSLRAHPCLI